MPERVQDQLQLQRPLWHGHAFWVPRGTARQDAEETVQQGAEATAGETELQVFSVSEETEGAAACVDLWLPPNKMEGRGSLLSWRALSAGCSDGCGPVHQCPPESGCRRQRSETEMTRRCQHEKERRLSPRPQTVPQPSFAWLVWQVTAAVETGWSGGSVQVTAAESAANVLSERATAAESAANVLNARETAAASAENVLTSVTRNLNSGAGSGTAWCRT